jgi:hypothetical protein
MARRRRRLFVLPRDHQPAMVVPREGARCSTCKFIEPSSGGFGTTGWLCSNRNYQRWAGTNLLVDPVTGLEVDPSRFCSDWYEPQS